MRAIHAVCLTVFFLAWANFMVFWVLGVKRGGDALNGKIEDGRYFVVNHARYTEVDRSTYEFSRYQAYSVFITHPLGFLSGGMLVWLEKRKRAM